MGAETGRSRGRRQRGATAVTLLVAMTALLASAMLAVDGGFAMLARTQLGAALDASVLAAAQELPSTTSARTIFNQYMASNTGAEVVFSTPTSSIQFGGEMTSAIQAEAQALVDLHFGPLFGINNVTVHAEARAEQVDPDLMLLLDTSNSMCEDNLPYTPGKCPPPPGPPWEPLHTVQNAGVSLAHELGDEAMMGLVYYNTKPKIQVTLKDVSLQLAQIEAGIWALSPSGNTDIGGAIRLATDHLVASARRNPKVIVIASDGRPNTKNAKYYGYTEAMKTYVRQQADYAATKRVRILSVAVGTLADKTLMRYLATKTGGKYYEVVDEIMLEDIFTEVAHVSTIRLVPTE